MLDDAHLAQPEEGRALLPQIGNIRFGAAAGATFLKEFVKPIPERVCQAQAVSIGVAAYG